MQAVEWRNLVREWHEILMPPSISLGTNGSDSFGLEHGWSMTSKYLLQKVKDMTKHAMQDVG